MLLFKFEKAVSGNIRCIITPSGGFQLSSRNTLTDVDKVADSLYDGILLPNENNATNFFAEKFVQIQEAIAISL